MILNTNEFLPYPHSDNRKKIKNWQWVHEKSRLPNDWDGIKMPLAMSLLPMALSGHCALRLGSKYTVVLGGGGNEFENGIPVERTGPEPTNHVNIYNHRYNQWITTLNPTTDENLEYYKKMSPMRQARMNHACVNYKARRRVKKMSAL